MPPQRPRRGSSFGTHTIIVGAFAIGFVLLIVITFARSPATNQVAHGESPGRLLDVYDAHRPCKLTDRPRTRSNGALSVFCSFLPDPPADESLDL